MIVLYMKNRPWGGEPRCDFVRVISVRPPQIRGYRIDAGRLVRLALPEGYLVQFRGWYHPATAWEMEEYRRLGGECLGPRQS